MRYVTTPINDDLFASEIVKCIDIFQAITWVAEAWKEFSVKTIMNCFAKCGITEQASQDEDDIMEEYIDFDVETCSFLPAIASDMVNWRVSSVKTSNCPFERCWGTLMVEVRKGDCYNLDLLQDGPQGYEYLCNIT